MSEGRATRERPMVLSPEEQIIVGHAESAVAGIRKGASYYPDIGRLLGKRTFSPEEMQESTIELIGLRWKYVFTRHSRSYFDIEIKKTPIRAGSDVTEEVLRLRRSVDPLARVTRLSQTKGVERYENDEQAYTQIDAFVG